MSIRLTLHGPAGRGARSQRGLSLIEMMVAILIALFLIGGIIAVEEGVNLSYGQQSGLAQLQDEQRFAMSVLDGVIGTAGYFPDPLTNSLVTALPASGNFGTAGQAIYGPASGTFGDSIYVRYMTEAGDGLTLCDGTSAATNTYTSYLYVAADTSGAGGDDLYCQLNGGTPVALVNGVTNMIILYGVATGSDNNVTEYLTSAQVTAASYWPNVTSVQVQLTFTNPLYTQSGQTVNGQPATVTFTRVMSIMGRVGVSQ